MNRKIYLLIILFNFCSGFADAQTSTKLDLRLWKRLQDGNIRKQNLPLLVRGDMNRIKELTDHFGGIYKYGYNDISSVEIPEKNLLEFSKDKDVEKIENTGAKGVFLMDTARMRNNIDSVHRGFSPLPNNLKGRNVVVGIIDGGIYWQHYDFRKPTDSTTRVKYIWDQATGGGTAPAPYNYGSEWNETQINNNTCTHVPPGSDFGHGTCVAGIAAGNGLSMKGTAYDSMYTGVAPEADIIAVRVDNSNFLSSVADAVDYIFKKADALGKPCVINTSIGTYYGSHDGIDLTTQMMETLLDEHGGRTMVAAAGNEGNIPFHLGYGVPADSAYTYFTYNSALGYHYFDFWCDTADFNNAVFKVGASDNNGNIINGTEYFNVLADFNPPQGNYTLQYRSLPNNSSSDDVYIAATLDGDRYHVEFQIYPSDISNYWRLQTSGTGRLDAWASGDVIGSSDMTSYLNGGIYITDSHYRHPDTLETMVSSWQNSDKVITVGNYSSRAGYLDYNSTYVDVTASPYNEIVGRKIAESSVGPTRDNRLKPDMMATGNTTITTGDANYISALIGSGQAYKVSVTGKHVRNGGTSMASPIVAGIAALYLEKHPNATYHEIKQALICSAAHDSFTGSTPNFEYGNGKVNAFAALTSTTCVIYGSPDTSCLNYNPVANLDTGCVPKVYGCTDTGSINYNSLANVNNGTCIPKVYGCTDTASTNYNSLANVNSGSCIPKVFGCMDTASINYNPLANENSGSCIPKVYGCTDTGSINYNSLANVNNGSCIPKVYGCMDTASINYNPLANENSGSCIPKVYGCTDTGSMNYNSLANIDNGSCIYGCSHRVGDSLVIIPPVIPYVTISSVPKGVKSICAGTSVIFSATPGNVRGTFNFQWKRNGANVGSNSTTYTTSALVNHDAISCVMSGNNICPSSYSVTSNTITITVTSCALSATGSVINATCTGSSNGSINLTPQGGTAPYTYLWSNSAITEDISGLLSGNYSVTITDNTSSTVSASFTVSSGIVPSTPGNIAHPGPLTGLCPAGVASTTYSIVPVTGASSYTWTSPFGTFITSGQGTTSITVSFNSLFTSGNITVKANSACGSSAANRLTIKSKLPVSGLISGFANGLCRSLLPRTTYYILPVAGATSYTWTVPAGDTIISGQGTTAVLVSFSSGFISGTISVTANNACGAGASRALTLYSKPATPRSIAMNPTVVCSGQSGVIFSIAAVARATSYTWTVPAGASIISGQGTTSVVVNFGVTGGTVSVTADNTCGNSKAAARTISFTCKRDGNEEDEDTTLPKETSSGTSMVVYPNPAGDGSAVYLLLNLPNEDENKTTIRIFDALGKLVYLKETTMHNNEAFEISNGLSSGMYIVEAVLPRKTYREKLIIDN